MIKKIIDGRTDLIFDLLNSGIPATKADENGVKLIQWAAYFGDVSAIKLLLSRGEVLESLGENFDLNGAVFHGHWQLCQFLIESGGDVNFVQKNTGETLLHSALCKANRPAYDLIVKLLLLNGAKPNITTIPNVNTDSFMRDVKTKGETPLHRAAAFGSEEVIDLLLASGANKEMLDANQETPLAWASWHLRPTSILRKLCYGKFKIHAENNSKYDHGVNWGALDQAILGKPRI